MTGGRRHRGGGLLAFLASVTLGLTASLSIVGCGDDDYLLPEPGNAKGTEMNMAGKGQPVAPTASSMAQSTPNTPVVAGDDATTPATCAPGFDCPTAGASCVLPMTSRQCTCGQIDGAGQHRLWICP